MHLDVAQILDLFARYGYIVVFVPICLESSGVPLPGETVLLIASFAAFKGALNIYWVIAVAAVAAIVGDNIGYWIGRTVARRLAEQYGHRVFLTPERLTKAEDFFRRHGGKAVFLARWTAGLRVAGAWAAGAVEMEWWRFFLWNAIGGIFWAAAVGGAGYALGSSYELVAKYMSVTGAVILGIILVGVTVWFVRRRRASEDAA